MHNKPAGMGLLRNKPIWMGEDEPEYTLSRTFRGCVAASYLEFSKGVQKKARNVLSPRALSVANPLSRGS